MSFKTGRLIMLLGAVAQMSFLGPVASPAGAQQWHDRDRDWQRYEERRDEGDRRDRERRRRKDAKTDGIVVGAVGAAVLVGVVAAIASSGKKHDRERNDYRDRDRTEYCRDRYGNYDLRSDSYRASDGRIYRCE